MAKRERSSDKITSIAAIIVAIAAIGISVWQGMDNRRHNRLSVRPKLQIIFRADPQGDAGFIVRNDGLGPANIKRFDVKLDDKLLDKVSFRAVLDLARIMGLDSLPMDFDPIVNTTTILPGDQARILTFLKGEGSNMKLVLDSMNVYLSRIDLDLEYESMYGESFSTGF